MYGTDDLPTEFDQLVTYRLHQEGIELTPDQVREHRRAAFSKIRTGMRERGYELPYSDSELLQLVQIAEERREEEFESADPIDVPQEQIDRILAQIKEERDLSNPKDWRVIGPGDCTLQRFESRQDAEKSCLERNKRAARWGLAARYSVLETRTGR